MNRLKSVVHLFAAYSLILGCTEQTPSRDHIPVLKQRLYDLQVAVKEHNGAAIDSLLSVDILSNGQSSDSLLSLVYGPDGSFQFDRFLNAEYVYDEGTAWISAYISDSTLTKDRPIQFTWAYQHDLWLLTEFNIGHPEVQYDSP